MIVAMAVVAEFILFCILVCMWGQPVKVGTCELCHRETTVENKRTKSGVWRWLCSKCTGKAGV